jgi:5-epi-alpha-selinene synthase
MLLPHTKTAPNPPPCPGLAPGAIVCATPGPRPVHARRRPPTVNRRSRPRLRCPLAPAINPHVEIAHRHTLAWTVDLGLVEAGSAKLERLAAARFAWLAARAYPTLDAEPLALVSDWLTFLFFYDDLCDTDEATDPARARELQALEDRLVELGHGAPARDDDTPLARSLADIRGRAAAGGEAWLERLGRHFHEYLEGCRWERLIRIEGRVPSLATYTKLRRLICGAFPCFDFAGMYVDGTSTTFADHVLVQQLEVMANNYLGWVNDVLGLDKDLREGTTSNLVIVLVHQYGLDTDEALDRAIELCNSELEAFLALERQLGLLVHADCRAYVAALAAWMRGQLDWSLETKRYAAGAPDSSSQPLDHVIM